MKPYKSAIIIAAAFCIGWMSASTKNKSQKIDQSIRRATSIGGIFFKCNDPTALKKWYSKHLGLNIDDYGTNFELRTAKDSSQKGFTLWGPFSNKTKYFDPSQKDFMINYRVENLRGLVETLQKEGVHVLDEIQVFTYGSFVHIMDIEGNKIELWEPNDVEYEKIAEGVTK